jgi:hypothetical protein
LRYQYGHSEATRADDRQKRLAEERASRKARIANVGRRDVSSLLNRKRPSVKRAPTGPSPFDAVPDGLSTQEQERQENGIMRRRFASADQEAAFKAVGARIKQEKQNFYDQTDGEYWACMVFVTRAQRDAFVVAMKWLDITENRCYVDGIEAAKRLGVPLPPAQVRFPEPKADGPMVASLKTIK